jgi:hypothetical protein
MERSTKTRLLTAVLLCAVFGSGVLLGFAMDSSLDAEQPEVSEAAQGAEQVTEEAQPQQQCCIYEQVEPNEAQLASIESLVAEYRARRDSLDEEMQARWNDTRRQIILELREAIKAALSPEQAAEYQRLLDEYEAKRAAEREN